MSSSSTKRTVSDTASTAVDATKPSLVAVTEMGNQTIKDTKSRTQLLRGNNDSLKKQEAEFRLATTTLAKALDKLVAQGNQGLKDSKPYGDLCNYQEVVDRDLLVLEECLTLIQRRVNPGA